ncbi:MAG: FtsX-like permease family protein [Dysgonamonadaceae bacterium]
MKTLRIIFRSFFKKGQNNIIKVTSLGIGLTVAMVLLAKVSFDANFDNFFPDAEHIYQIQSRFKPDKSSSEEQSSNSTSGAIAIGMKNDIPGVKLATRFTPISGEEVVFKTSDNKKYKAGFILADSCFFEMFPRKITAESSPGELLSRPMTALIAKSVAAKMGNKLIGKSITIEAYPGRELVIAGIFDDFPLNSHLRRCTAVISMSSIGRFTWDGSMNWLGNDRYLSYVKISPNVNPVTLEKSIRRMQVKYQNIEQLEKENNLYLKYDLESLPQLHSGSKEVKRMMLVLSVVAFSLIFTAVLNYLLIVITSMFRKTKEVAINKCYGASAVDIVRQTLTETVFHFGIALLMSLVLIFLFKHQIENLLGIPVYHLFSWKACSLIGGLFVMTCLIASIIPSSILCRIPVTSAFRGYSQSRRTWKQVFLFIQVVGAAFLVSFLVIIGKQYNLMINENLGYNYSQLSFVKLTGLPPEKISLVRDKIGQLPQVTSVSTADCLPIGHASGNNVSLIGGKEDLFNIADLYSIDSNYIATMEIPIVAGKNFDKESQRNDVIVSRSFAEKMKILAGWKDIIGKNLNISEHGQCRVTGVYSDIRIGSLRDNDTRPSAMFYSEVPSSILIIKIKNIQGNIYQQIQQIFQEIIPDKETDIMPYKDNLISQYSDVKNFRDAIFIGSLVTLLITLIGLIGYMNSEMQRRTSEIAIRKVTGATLADIFMLFVREPLISSPLAILLGCVATLFIGREWMNNFAEKVAFSPFTFISCGLFILLIIEIVVVLNCYRVANQNPVKSLKSE